MAHGAPKICVCEECDMYGLIPRFSENICPECGNPVKQITNGELKRILNIPVYKDFYPSFCWNKIMERD